MYDEVCPRLWPSYTLCFQELRNAQSEQLMGIRREEEMEMSDDENCDSPTKKIRVDESGNADNSTYPWSIILSVQIIDWD